MKDINTAYREIQLRHGVADETATDKEPAPTASDSHEDTCGSTGGGPDVAQADTQREINRVAREEMQRLDAELELMRQRLRRESVGQRAKMSVKKKDKPAQRHAERPRKGSGSAASATSCADSVSYDAKKLPTAPDIVKPVEPEPNSTANSPQSGPTSPVQIAVFELSMHPLAVAVRMNLIYAFHSLLETQIHSFDSCEQVSIHDKLDAEGNNVLHYCVYFGRLEITSYVLAVAGINWTDLVFDLNKVGLKPSEIVGKSYNNQEYGDFKEGGNTSKCHKSTEHEQVVEKLKHFEANHRSVFDLEHRKFDWMMVLAFIVEVFGVLKILHIEAAVSGVHLLGRYETILAVALRMAPVINASSLHIVAAITFMVTAALRILLHSSWLKLSFGGITLIFSVLGIKCCCPGVLGLLLAVALIVNHLVLLLFRILSIPSAIFGHLFQILVMPNIDTFLKEVDDAKEKKRMLFLLWKLQSIVMYCILWFVINICCVVLNKLFVTTGVNETNDSDVNTGVSFD